jgi:transposase InsO family protein
VDYRRLNDATYKDAYPLPRIDDTLDSLGGNSYFSTLDLTSGYWQVGLTADAADKTAFNTPGGLYQFNVLPFGLTNAPGTFQRAMEYCLSGLQWEQCLVYLDDVIVFSRTFTEHLDHLQNVFDRFSHNGLKLKPSKCTFAKQQVNYLGHVISNKGIHADPKKISAVEHWPIPTCVKEIQSFLGLASYYRKFVQGFATIAAPLHQLCSSKTVFQWGSDQQRAFDTLKLALVSSPVLGYPDFALPFRLEVYASGYGLGAILSQRVGNRDQVIAYASRVMSSCETRYPIMEKEALALVFGVKTFKPYLYGKPFTLISDHDPLTYLRRTKDLSGRIWRWMVALEPFQYIVLHRAGAKHGNADALSRRPPDSTVNSVQTSSDASGFPEKLSSLSPYQYIFENDETYVFIKRSLEGEDISVPSNSYTRHFLKNRSAYTLVNQYIYYKGLFLVPTELIPIMLRLCHDNALAGHLGVLKTVSMMEDRLFWPSLRPDVRRYVLSCDRCQRRKRNYNQTYSPLTSVTTNHPGQRIAIDIVSLPPSRGYTCALVVVDYFTRWPEAYPLRNHTAETVAKVLFQQYFCRYGIPESVHSDRGAEFQSILLQELYVLMGVRGSRTTAYHPQGDGLVERQIQTICESISHVDSERSSWVDNLYPVLFGYRVAVQESLGFSPYEMMFGRPPKLPIDLQLGFNLGPYFPSFSSMRNLQARMRTIHTLAINNLRKAQARQKEFYERRRKVGRPFQVDDLVMVPVIPKGRNTKLDDKWFGPFRILHINPSGVITLQDYPSKGKTDTVAQDRLKLYHVRSDPLANSGYFHRFPKSLNKSSSSLSQISSDSSAESSCEDELEYTPQVPVPPGPVAVSATTTDSSRTGSDLVGESL